MIQYLPVALAAWILCGSYAQTKGEPSAESRRILWIELGALILFALVAPNPWMGALLLLPLVTWTHPPLLRAQREPFLFQSILWGGLYVALAPHVTLAWLPWILGAIVTVGMLAGLWSIHNLLIEERPYERIYDLFGWKIVVWDSQWSWHGNVGLGNDNHNGAVSAMATAAGIGLMLMGYVFVWPCILLAALPMGLHIWKRDPHGDPSAADGYALVLFAAGFILWNAPYGLLFTATLAAFGTALLYRNPRLLSERGEVWGWLVQQVRARPWQHQLVGTGSGAWLRDTMTQRPFVNIMVQPHNDLLAMLYEHGIVGLAVLCGYLGTSFWTAFFAGPAGGAVFLLGSVILACALVSSPWHPYTEIVVMAQDRSGFQIRGQGCPAINLISFAAVLCVEALT